MKLRLPGFLRRVLTMPTHSGAGVHKFAPVPANPFAPGTTATATSLSSRPVSPRQRDSHHFARSPVRASCSPPRSPTLGTRGGASTTRTVVLHKACLPDAPQTPTLGLSLRTVQSKSLLPYLPYPFPSPQNERLPKLNQFPHGLSCVQADGPSWNRQYSPCSGERV